ncbi:hypothetical protein H311_04785, partial [Anncaliia algerae PRA109]
KRRIYGCFDKILIFTSKRVLIVMKSMLILQESQKSLI